MNVKELSVLIAGCGSIGKRHARILASLGVKNIRACDPNEKQLRSLTAMLPQVKTCNSYEEGLKENPTAVYIMTPPRLHIPMAIQAIEGGCHVFCEKPLSDTLSGVDNLSEIVAKSGKKMMIGLCFRYHKGLLKAKHLLESGEIGRLVSVRALMGEHLPEVRPDYRTLFTSKYSGAFDLIHDIDLALGYANQPVKRVYSIHGNYSDIDIEAPDIVEILIGFQDRTIASVHLDFFQRPRRRQMELIGTEGVIIVEFASWNQYTLSIYRVQKGFWETNTYESERDDMFMDEDREFIEAILFNKPIRCTIDEARKSLEVVVAAQQRAPREG